MTEEPSKFTLEPGECIVVDGDGPEAEATVARFNAMGLPARLGAIVACDKCGFLCGAKYVNEPVCTVCVAIAEHQETCKYRRAMTCKIGIDCDHGLYVCETCDPCTCS